MEKPTLAIVVPCYNEEEVLPITVKALSEVLRQMLRENLISDESFILFVDDGSKDDTWDLIKQYHNTYSGIKGLKLVGNVGQQKATLAALEFCQDKCDCLITIDSDLQEDESKIKEMVKLFREGNEIVYGVRKDRSSDSFFKRTTALMFYKLMQAMKVPVVYNNSEYRLISKRVIKTLLKYEERNIFVRGIITSMGFKSANVYYTRKPRLAGETKYSLTKLLSIAIDAITSFSIAPLRFISFMGLLSFIISIIMTFFVFYAAFFTNTTVPGWASTLISIYFIGSVQLISIGVIGEYIGKIYKEVKRRPHYLVDEILK